MGEVVKTSGGIRQHSPTRSEWMWPELCLLEGPQLSPHHWDVKRGRDLCRAARPRSPCRHASSHAGREFMVALSTGTGTRPFVLAVGQPCRDTQEPVYLARSAGDTLP